MFVLCSIDSPPGRESQATAFRLEKAGKFFAVVGPLTAQ
jgi:hypothetical protein